MTVRRLIPITINSCGFCNLERDLSRQEQWWTLEKYKGHTGYCCPSCYNRISAMTEEEGCTTMAVASKLLTGEKK